MKIRKDKLGNWAIVNGASSRIGEEFSNQRACQKFNLVSIVRRENLLKQLSEKLNNMKNLKLAMVFIASVFLLQSCGIADLRTTQIKKEGFQIENIKKGKLLLANAWKKQGMDKLENHKTYSFDGKDTWKGMLGNMGKIWHEKNSELEFKYRINSFDGQVTFLDGVDKGTSSGLQNWNYYDIINGKPIFSDKDAKANRRKVFGIAAYQYFSEMINRLKNAPIIMYAGEDELRGQKYDLVFCTWDTPNPHMEDDQYVVWINKKTGLMDFAQYTIRESYLKPPGYKTIGGGVEFTDFQEIDGILIPHSQIVYAIKLNKNPEKYLHKLSISNFKFDAFEESDLKVDEKMTLGNKSKK